MIDGCKLGWLEGWELGCELSVFVGCWLGWLDGCELGVVGDTVGEVVGGEVGLLLGAQGGSIQASVNKHTY